MQRVVPEPGQCAGLSLLIALELCYSSPSGFVPGPMGSGWSYSMKWLLSQKSVAGACPSWVMYDLQKDVPQHAVRNIPLTALFTSPGSVSSLWILCSCDRLLLGAFKELMGCPHGKSVVSFSSPAYLQPGASNIVLLLLTEGRNDFVPCPFPILCSLSGCARSLVPCPSPARGQGGTCSECRVYRVVIYYFFSPTLKRGCFCCFLFRRNHE